MHSAQLHQHPSPRSWALPPFPNIACLDPCAVHHQRQADCFAWGLSYCAAEHLDWSHRWPLITQVLEAAGADVICLQEVDASR